MSGNNQKGCVVNVPRSFTGKTVQEVIAQVRRLLESGPGSLTFDFKDTSFIDSCGIGQLVAIAKELQAKQSTMTLSNLKEDVLQLFVDTGLDQIFAIEGSEKHIIDIFGSSVDIRLTVTFEEEGDVYIFKMAGIMDNVYGSRFFKQQFLLALAEHRKLLLNFSDLTFLDSASVSVLIDMHRLLKETGGEMRICGVNFLIEDLFNTLNLKAIIPVYPECKEALASWN
jgi:anti-anti-sigma factor